MDGGMGGVTEWMGRQVQERGWWGCVYDYDTSIAFGGPVLAP